MALAFDARASGRFQVLEQVAGPGRQATAARIPPRAAAKPAATGMPGESGLTPLTLSSDRHRALWSSGWSCVGNECEQDGLWARDGLEAEAAWSP
jgi:hypothetical protein